MKVMCYICMGCWAMLCDAKAGLLLFDSLDDGAQAYVVEQLTRSVRDADIVILHQRCDEWSRNDDAGLSKAQQQALDLTPSRFIRTLKGAASVACNDVVYVYRPSGKEWRALADPRNGSPATPPPYRPLFFSDDWVRLVFVERQLEPIRGRIADRAIGSSMEPFVQSAMKMGAATFMTKYGLADTFSNRVYKVLDGCVFHVDYPVPDMGETELMRANRQNLELSKAGVPKLQKANEMIHLSKREVSEIVFIAYSLGGGNGIAAYAAASKDNPLMETITSPVFVTSIGKRLYGALAKAGGPIPDASRQRTNQAAAPVKTGNVGGGGSTGKP